METGSRSALLCDFDETVVDLDTGILILTKFADGDWRTLDEEYNTGRMPVQEVIRRQFAMVRATRKSMLDLVERSTSMRPGFAELVNACQQRGIPVIIVSYGLDFCIDHLLATAGLSKRVKVIPQGQNHSQRDTLPVPSTPPRRLGKQEGRPRQALQTQGIPHILRRRWNFGFPRGKACGRQVRHQWLSVGRPVPQGRPSVHFN